MRKIVCRKYRLLIFIQTILRISLILALNLLYGILYYYISTANLKQKQIEAKYGINRPEVSEGGHLQYGGRTQALAAPFVVQGEATKAAIEASYGCLEEGRDQG